MRLLTKHLTVLICATLLWVAPARAEDAAVRFTKDLADKVITNVLATHETKDQKMAAFRRDFTGALDLKAIGQFVLGRYWKKTPVAERDDFLNAFMEFNTLTWSDRFDLYNGQTISFAGSRNAEGNQLYVDSTIDNNGSPVEVIWRLRPTKSGDYKIIDIVVAGVSMAMSYRNEYASFLQQHGGNVNELTAELNNRIKNFVPGSEKNKKK